MRDMLSAQNEEGGEGGADGDSWVKGAGGGAEAMGRSVSSPRTAPEWLAATVCEGPSGSDETVGSDQNDASSRPLSMLSPALDRAMADAVAADPRTLGENLVCLVAEVRRLKELNTHDVRPLPAAAPRRRGTTPAARCCRTVLVWPASHPLPHPPQTAHLQEAYVSYELLRQRLLPLEEGAKEQVGQSQAAQLLRWTAASQALPEKQRRLCGNLIHVIMEHEDIQVSLQRCAASPPPRSAHRAFTTPSAAVTSIRGHGSASLAPRVCWRGRVPTRCRTKLRGTRTWLSGTRCRCVPTS